MANQKEDYTAKTTRIIGNKINGIISTSEILSNKKPMGGKVGNLIQKQRQGTARTGKGNNTFKEFDDWAERIERQLNGISPTETNKKILANRRIKIRRRNTTTGK